MRVTTLLLALAVALPATGAASSALAEGESRAGGTAGAQGGEGHVATGGDAGAGALPGRQPGADDFGMPPEMVRKLSPEQIVSVLREREIRRGPFSGRPADRAGTAMFFGALVAMVLVAQVFATARERMRQGTLRAMVEKGMDIPPDLVVKRPNPVCDLRRGLVLIGAGVGLSLVFALIHLGGRGGPGLWSVGLVPLLMGTGYLVVWRLETRNTQRT